jgi:hypothetical protein
MPYSNVVFVKLLCELAHDRRFTDGLDDDGKLVYFCLLLFMGLTKNDTPNDPKWMKRTLNLTQNEQKIVEKINEITSIFPKTVVKNGSIKFLNYNSLHNYIGKSLKNNTDFLWMSQKRKEKNKKRKEKIREIIEGFIRIKKFPVRLENGDKDKNLENYLFKRNVRAAGELAEICEDNANKVIEAMEWFGGICEKKGLTWGLETIVKWYPEYLVKGRVEDTIPNTLIPFLKKGEV